jgi:hypothetical protein
LPPVQECREFYSLDAAGDSESQEQTVEMGLHRSTSHIELSSDFVVVATLQEQFDDLLFALPQTDRSFAHSIPPN